MHSPTPLSRCSRGAARGVFPLAASRVVRGCAILGGVLLHGGCPPRTNVPASDVGVGAELVAGGLTAPVALAVPPDGSGRLFVVSQPGEIVILDGEGGFLRPAFLNLRDRVIGLSPAYDERGLLGLAFHPNYRSNGRFFVFYTPPPSTADVSCDVRISEFAVSSTDANVADPSSERIILNLPHPQSNHCGGQLAFGPDGYLYFSLGDGGGAGDLGAGHNPDIGNAQDRASLFGKIGRIDVDAAAPYAVPPDNPLIGDPLARAEIWASGFRNVWKFSFDDGPGGTDRLFAGDVGQGQREEIDIVEAGGNYGWRIREGTTCFNVASFNSPLADCAGIGPDGQPLIPPILEYDHGLGFSVIGGFVYRGRAIPPLQGSYVFGDLGSAFLVRGRLMVARERDDGAWSFEELLLADRGDGRLGRFIYSFGRDDSGELYVLTNSSTSPVGAGGEVFKLVPAVLETN